MLERNQQHSYEYYKRFYSKESPLQIRVLSLRVFFENIFFVILLSQNRDFNQIVLSNMLNLVLQQKLFNSGMSEPKATKPQLKTKKIKKQSQPQPPKQQPSSNPPKSNSKPDNRFNKAQYDPKFLTPSAKLTKVKVDKRFDKMFKNPEFKTSSAIDRYGRKINPDEQNKELKQYYYMEQQEEEHSQAIQDEQAGEAIEGEEQVGGITKWMQNYDEQSSSLSQIPYGEEEEAQDVWQEQSQHVIKGQNVQATKRLALCNYDWMNISSKDLMILFNSFKTNTGYIKSVKVYMSNLGKQKLEEQEKFGPRGIWKQNPQQQFEQQKKEWRKTFKQLLQQRQQDQNAFDQQKLRQYEKERLKYFYAVIECDSKKTADEIYKQCDGNQFQNSNLQFDLRFIPDELQFDHSNLKEECNQIPVAGEVKNFVTKALGHSKVSLSWEDPELSLAASLKKKNWNRLTDKELDNIDWGMYINEEDAKNEDGFRKIAAGESNKKEVEVVDWRRKGNKKDRNNDQDDIQITFEGGFDKKSKSKKKNQQVQEEQPSLNKQKKSLKEKRNEKEREKLKRKQQLELLVEDTKKSDFQVDLNDDRFKAVYENANYSIDPVDHRFDHRKSGKIFQQIVKRNRNKGSQ